MKLLKIKSKNDNTLDAILMVVPDDYDEAEALEAAIDLDNPVIAEEINIGDVGDFDLYHPFLG